RHGRALLFPRDGQGDRYGLDFRPHGRPVFPATAAVGQRRVGDSGLQRGPGADQWQLRCALGAIGVQGSTLAAMARSAPSKNADWPEGAIFTVGHSTLPIEQFIALLKAYGIERLADVRTVPR